MENALRSAANGMSQREAGKVHAVPRATLQKLIAGKTYIGAKPIIFCKV